MKTKINSNVKTMRKNFCRHFFNYSEGSKRVSVSAAT